MVATRRTIIEKPCDESCGWSEKGCPNNLCQSELAQLIYLFPTEQCHCFLDELGLSGSLDRKQSGELPPGKKGYSLGSSAISRLILAHSGPGRRDRQGMSRLCLSQRRLVAGTLGMFFGCQSSFLKKCWVDGHLTPKKSGGKTNFTASNGRIVPPRWPSVAVW